MDYCLFGPSRLLEREQQRRKRSAEDRRHPDNDAGHWLVLFMLILAYVLNFLDRQIISILAVPIQKEFALTDTQLGLLGGIAFGAVYSVLTLPAAWLADRLSRSGILAAALFIWSGFTAACGMATGFVGLFIARMGVGVGEAGGVAPAYSLIADIFPARQRARALALFSCGIPIGAAAGVLFGGYIAKTVDWRFAFISIGVAGMMLAPLFKLAVKDPPRRQADGNGAAPTLGQVFGIVAAKPSFWLLSMGAGFASLVGYGLIFWLPSFLFRSVGMDLFTASQFLAAIVLFGGVTGMALGGVLADWLGQKSKSYYGMIPAVALVLAIPLYIFGTLSTSTILLFWLFLISQALGLMWLGPILTAVQHLGPVNARSQVSAIYLLVNNLIGLGLGPFFFGHVSDLLKAQYGADSIKYAFIAGLSFYFLSAILLLAASKRLSRDWEE